VEVKPYLVQINNLVPEGWRVIYAHDRKDAALAHLRKQKDPLSWLPCTIYVSIGETRHENGAPMAIEAFSVVLSCKPASEILAKQST